MADDEYPARSALSSQSAVGEEKLFCPVIMGSLLDVWLSEPNERVSSEASGIPLATRSPTMKVNPPSADVNVSRRLELLQIRRIATGEGGGIPVSITTLPE